MTLQFLIMRNHTLARQGLDLGLAVRVPVGYVVGSPHSERAASVDQSCFDVLRCVALANIKERRVGMFRDEQDERENEGKGEGGEEEKEEREGEKNARRTQPQR